jgi:hypothetical protein
MKSWLTSLSRLAGTILQKKQGSNVVLTGPSRAGTTLVCYLLNKLPDVIALHEPIRGLRRIIRSREKVLQATDVFFNDMRRSLYQTRTAFSKNANGTIPDNPISSSPGKREAMVKNSLIKFNKELSRNFLLAVKHNAVFAVLLPELAKKYPCYSVIRNPLSILASWNSITIPLSRGSCPPFEAMEPGFKRSLQKISDLHDKQLFILSAVFEKFMILPKNSILRYEDIVSSGGKALARIVPGAAFLEEDLENKNLNELYDRELMLQLGEKLLKYDGAFWEFYGKNEVEDLLAGIR